MFRVSGNSLGDCLDWENPFIVGFDGVIRTACCCSK